MKILAIILSWAALLPLCSVAQELGKPLETTQGLTLQLDDQHQLNMQVVERKVVLYFLDAEGLLMRPPFQRVIVEMEEAHGDDSLHLTMRPDGQTPYLTHPRTVPPPYRYRVRMLLYPTDGSDEGRILVTERDFQQKQ